ncbi:LysR family transcriptional regulator [uncultured Tateyamaria sp.]|uniref:LysR family transcriptional regulator n=1 Tax=uncultured Tateyamaria sp. TaxID=455651 RepID=UPI002601E283|nr:LysR family transcriptional regulator [uncultured Tateyamaria sp.]
MLTPDWTQMQSFAAVAEHGSLSAAARALGSSQPTLSRHIALLESDLGTRLFDRSRGGMALTAKGKDLVAHAGQMADAAARFAMTATGRGSDLAGTVRITASQVVATYVLPAQLKSLRDTYPEIAIEVVASDSTDNLLRREADIALRMYRPTQQDVIAQHVADVPVAAYAAHAYIAQHGQPDSLADIRNHVLIGYDRSTLLIDGFARAGFEVTRDSFALRCDDQVACWEMVVAGCGIGFGQMSVGDADPRVVRVSGDNAVATLPMWLTAHGEVRTSPRVRRVYDWLARSLRA